MYNELKIIEKSNQGSEFKQTGNIREIRFNVNVKEHNYPVDIFLNIDEIQLSIETGNYLKIIIDPNMGVCLIGSFEYDIRHIWEPNDCVIFDNMITDIETFMEKRGYNIHIKERKLKEAYIAMPHLYLNLEIND